MFEKLLIYRMIHISNLDYIIKKGLWSMRSGVLDEHFKPIGNSEIIGKREIYPVRINPPGGVLGDYIPFYFAGHSPMLLNIATGYGVPAIHQEDIVFLVCDAIKIVSSGQFKWCFTDGNAKKEITGFYADISDFEKLDWKVIESTWWKADEEDMDKPRKKMAEFLVQKHLPFSQIIGIIVRNQSSENYVRNVLNVNNVDLPVYVDKYSRYFYAQYL